MHFNYSYGEKVALKPGTVAQLFAILVSVIAEHEEMAAEKTRGTGIFFCRNIYPCPRFFFALIEKIIVVGREQVIVSLLNVRTLSVKGNAG